MRRPANFEPKARGDLGPRKVPTGRMRYDNEASGSKWPLTQLLLYVLFGCASQKLHCQKSALSVYLSCR